MLTSSGPSPISPVYPSSKVYPSGLEHGLATPAAPGHKFDSLTLTSAPAGERRFYMDMVSRLSKEVRTATTTGVIQSLRQEVSSGVYRPDPMAIAANILFLGEEV